MTDDAARTNDDTVERGLADELLASGDPPEAETEVSQPEVSGPEASEPAAAASTWSDLSDDEDYLAPAARRGKLTTGLIVALIFLVGLLVGTVLTKTLSPAPAPQIVYVLNDSGTAAPSASPSGPR